MPRIARIDPAHPLYPGECRLREDVLLRAVGYDMPSFIRDYPYEHRFEHYVAVVEHPTGPAVVGCALLLPDHPEPGTGKVMQVAVDPQRRGEGIGRLLMTTIESRAFGELGLRRLYCHAQRPAVAFYDQLAWRGEGPVFIEAGIEHLRMVMDSPVLLAADQPDPATGEDALSPDL